MSGFFTLFGGEISFEPVPEPGVAAIFGLGLLAMGASRRTPSRRS
ncbi:MAG: PEP-CTERM sorting domain-containing protein [Chromatiales bacterium]|nr:PEP-CTERM sorting domain-containing protein [Chromatiales bacterium]